MNWPLWTGGLILVVGLLALLYWQLSLAEGVYLGRRVVVWLYDLYASRYDETKRFEERDESWFLGAPLAQALEKIPLPLVLDVATGTGRLPRTLFQESTFAGRVVGLDLSRQMLRHAAHNHAAHKDRLTLLWQGATRLPFSDATFDAVTCLEALEFLPDRRATLSEMVRVLRPGGVLLTSNRTGPSARWLPGRTVKRADFAALLESLLLEDVRVHAWQVDYDIAWARKPGQSTAAAPSTLPELLRCPRCDHNPLTRQPGAFRCEACASRYPIAVDGVIEMGW